MLTESRFVKMPGQSKLGFRDYKSEYTLCSLCVFSIPNDLTPNFNSSFINPETKKK